MPSTPRILAYSESVPATHPHALASAAIARRRRQRHVQFRGCRHQRGAFAREHQELQVGLVRSAWTRHEKSRLCRRAAKQQRVAPCSTPCPGLLRRRPDLLPRRRGQGRAGHGPAHLGMGPLGLVMSVAQAFSGRFRPDGLLRICNCAPTAASVMCSSADAAVRVARSHASTRNCGQSRGSADGTARALQDCLRSSVRRCRSAGPGVRQCSAKLQALPSRGEPRLTRVIGARGSTGRRDQAVEEQAAKAALAHPIAQCWPSPMPASPGASIAWANPKCSPIVSSSGPASRTRSPVSYNSHPASAVGCRLPTLPRTAGSRSARAGAPGAQHRLRDRALSRRNIALALLRRAGRGDDVAAHRLVHARHPPGRCPSFGR